MSDIAGTSCVILKTPAQVGKTESILNFFGWICEYDRANTMLILDTQKSGEKMSKNRIRPFLRETCGINNPKNTIGKNPDKSNSVMNIGLGSGANLLICSAKSASDLRSTPVKYLLMDELDAWPEELKGEGDPVQLALQRQMRYRGMAVMTSTPTGFDGRIYKQYLQGTQQTWCAVCDCGELLPCRWDDISFENDTPVITCPQCGQILAENDVKQLAHVYTQPKNLNPFCDEYGRIWRSFEIFGTLCHEFYSWDGLKRQELTSLALGDASYQSFRNTRLGEVYKPIGDIDIDKNELMKACLTETGDYLNSDIAFICLGIDTHDSGLYLESVGFSADLKRQYGLGFELLTGDPNDPEVWELVDQAYDRIYTKQDGTKLKAAFGFADSGGHRSNAVYRYSMRNRRFLAIKGFVSNNPRTPDPLVDKFRKVKVGGGLKGSVQVLFIGVNAGKDRLSFLELQTIAGDQRLFYKQDLGYDLEYFNGLLSEKKINGKWIAPKKMLFNEPLDCRVYAMACAEYYNNKYYLRGKDKGGIVKDEPNEPKILEAQADKLEEMQEPKTKKPNIPHL